VYGLIIVFFMMLYSILMCGVIGIMGEGEGLQSKLMYRLKLLQHRGKDGYGISCQFKGGSLLCKKEEGLIRDDFIDRIPENKNNKLISCIGHVRYSTSGNSKDTGKINKSEIQPLIRNCKDISQSISIAHNGNIPKIKDTHDTSFILNKLSEGNPKTYTDYENTLIQIMKTFPASYCIITQYKDAVYIMKDRYGVRPLSYGFHEENAIVASETIALENCNGITEVRSGEIIRFMNCNPETIYQDQDIFDYLCVFELIYFMNPLSNYKKKLVLNFRKDLVQKLVASETIQDTDYIVIGVPNSGIIYGKEYARLMKLRYKQSISKKDNGIHGEDRTFTVLDSNDRKALCKKKFKYCKGEINGKKIIILDDTIVRGTVMSQVVKDLKECGASEIHIRIPAPPVIDICQLGIAIHDKGELFMHGRTVQEAVVKLGVDSLRFGIREDIPENMYQECFGGGIQRDII